VTVRNPPSFLQGIVDTDLGHSAQNDRLTIHAVWLPGADPLSARSGIIPAPAGGMGEVTLLSDALARVAPFRAVLQGTRNDTQGQYVTVNDADLDLPLTEQEAGVARLDLLVVTVRDAQYAPDTLDDGDVVVVRGDPAVTDPVPPILDGPDLGNYLVLGTFTVPPPGTPVTFAPAPDLLTVPVGGILPVTNDDLATRVPPAYEGQYRDLGGRLSRATAGGWAGTVPKYWGYYESPVEADWPTIAQGAQYGDTLHSRWHECAFVYGTSSTWRQVNVTQSSNPQTTKTNIESRGGSLHNGFLIFDTARDRLWVSDGVIPSAGMSPAGGKVGAWQSNVTALAGWTVTGSFSNLGNGMARVYLDATKTGSALTVTATGDIGNIGMANLPVGWESEVATPLSTAAFGRMAMGGIGTGSRGITLAAVAPGSNIAVGEIIQLAGVYPLNNPFGLLV